MKLWDDICDSNVSGAKYRFVREAFFNMEDMDRHEYRYMINRDDVDIMFSMGTASGVYFARNEKKNRFMNMYAADPIESGIIKSETERYDNRSFALVDTTPYIRQLDAGYKFLKFKKLGVVYEDSEDAYIYSGISTIEAKADEYGFEVVYENVDEPVDEEDYDRYYSELKKAYRKLVDEGIDCLLVTLASIEYEDKMQELLDDSIIPAKVKTLEELDMVCEATPKIGVNYTTASKIGFDISFKDLQMVDYIYRNDKDK